MNQEKTSTKDNQYDNKPSYYTTESINNKETQNENISSEDIYEFYKKNLLPSIYSSLPILLSRMTNDAKGILGSLWHKSIKFITPNWKTTPKLPEIWATSPASWKISTNSLADWMLSHFDSDKDGHISASELMQMKENLLLEITSSMQEPQSWVMYWWRNLFSSFPLVDWKVGMFLWKTFGGLLFVIAVLSILPGKLHVVAGRIMRWPILGLTYFLIGVELIVYIIIRLFIRIVETIIANPKHRALRRKMANAKSYKEWYEIAQKLDKSQGRDKWQSTIDDVYFAQRYNWAFIQELISDMRYARQANDSFKALAVLQQCTRKNVGGIMSDELFSYTNTGEPKDIVIEFIDEVVETLKWITLQASYKRGDIISSVGGLSEELLASLRRSQDFSDVEKYEKKLIQKIQEEKNKIYSSLISIDMISNRMNRRKSSSKPIGRTTSVVNIAQLSGLPAALHREKVKTFLKRARAAYGRTALCLSGGAMMGNYHFGVIKALLEEDCLPHIISGTSAGSVIGAILCTRSDEELEKIIKPEILVSRLTCFSRSWSECIKSAYKTGQLFDAKEWLDLIKWFTLGDLTFEEAYQKTGRIFCITLSATTKLAPPALLNYISAPNVVIASAIIASAALPGLINPVVLQVKDSNGVVQNREANKDQAYWDGSIDQDIPRSGLSEMLNCQFFLASQCNPHIVPFFYNRKGTVGMPSRWSRAHGHESWRGGFLLSALELYLKGDMKAKFQFLNDIEAAVGPTGKLWTQSYEGTTTIVPKVSLIDYFKLMTNPNMEDLHRYFQGGSVAAYQQVAMVKQHYRVANAIEDCLAILENDNTVVGEEIPSEHIVSTNGS